MPTPGYIIVGNGQNTTLRGSAGDDAFDGSGAGETFFTGQGNDVVYAGAGDDVLMADLGNDRLDGGSGTDIVSFQFLNASGSNGEWANIGITFYMSKTVHNFSYYGTKTLYNIEGVRGTAAADKLYGTDRVDILEGWFGDDRLEGRGGNDRLRGDDGADTLIGGDGDDILEGGQGADRFFAGEGRDVLYQSVEDVYVFDDYAVDTFIYNSIKYSGNSAATRDFIFGHFEGPTSDKIDLSGIDANGSKAGDGKFTYIGDANLGSNSTSQVQVRQVDVVTYAVKVDIDNDNGSEMQLLVYSETPLTKDDFIL